MAHHLAPNEALILEIMNGEVEMFGLQIVEASGGKLTRQSIYVTLSRMEAKGFITSRIETAHAVRDQKGWIGGTKRFYKTSKLGFAHLAAYRTIAALEALEGPPTRPRK